MYVDVVLEATVTDRALVGCIKLKIVLLKCFTCR